MNVIISKQQSVDGMPDVSMESLFYISDRHVYYKDLQGKYLNCNDAAADFLQVAKEDLLNKFDTQFPWRDCSLQWRENEFKVKTNNKALEFYESQIMNNRKYFFRTLKMPVYVQRKYTGTIVLAQHQKQIDLDARLQETKFSKQQLECLYYLIKGFTQKQIAEILMTPLRSIQSEVANLKKKLNCQYRGELIAKALQLPWIEEKLFVDSLLQLPEVKAP